MAVLIIASSQPRVGRSTIAAALAYRFGRDGKPVTLARLAGDDSADADARAFASLAYINSPGQPLSTADVAALATMGNVIVEAPSGAPTALAPETKARIIDVRSPSSPALDGAVGTILTGVAAAEVTSAAARDGVLAVLPEDRTLAAPSVTDIAAALKGKWLVENETHGAIGRVMIGTVASDAASPYFEARDRKCVVTRYDKTDIQLAALLTDMELLVLTGGGQPSPYLLDRAAGTRDNISVLLAETDTVDSVRSIEGLFGQSRFEGQAKLERAVELLDAAGVNVDLA
jgi:BioD-like phosphotransacetylase family protein